MDENADMMQKAAELFVRQDMEVDYQISQLSEEQCRRILSRMEGLCKDLLRAAFGDDVTIELDNTRHVAPVEAVEAKLKEMEGMETADDWFYGL